MATLSRPEIRCCVFVSSDLHRLHRLQALRWFASYSSLSSSSITIVSSSALVCFLFIFVFVFDHNSFKRLVSAQLDGIQNKVCAKKKLACALRKLTSTRW